MKTAVSGLQRVKMHNKRFHKIDLDDIFKVNSCEIKWGHDTKWVSKKQKGWNFETLKSLAAAMSKAIVTILAHFSWHSDLDWNSELHRVPVLGGVI